jgi:type III secretion protein J
LSRLRRSRLKVTTSLSVYVYRTFRNALLVVGVALSCVGCDEQIIHDLSEQEANRVVSRLGAGSLNAKKVQQSDGRWAIAVGANSTVAALLFLESNRVLTPRAPTSSAGSKGGFVPSREEQWFRYERSVALSIEDSLGTVLGVLEARVHLNLPETDPLFGTRKESIGSGSVLLLIDERYESKDEEVAALVAGAAGIPTTKVTVLKSRPRMAQRKSVAVQDSQGDAASSPESLIREDGATTVPSSYHEAQVALASCAALVLVGFGTVVSLKRRKKVRFPLPSQVDDEV